MSFGASKYLLLLTLVPILLTLFSWSLIARSRRLKDFADAPLLESLILNWNRRQIYWRFILWIFTLICLIVALSRPTWGVAEEVVEARGLAIIIVLDVSSSMDAQDIQPSRLERAKRTAKEIFHEMDGNQLGLILFAGSAFVQLPPTTDANIGEVFLKAATTHSISRQGTALADALGLAINTFDDRITSDGIIIVLSDGENHEGDPVAVAETAAARGLVIHSIGYGDPIEGEPIPITNPDGTFANDYKTDAAGRLVLSRLDEDVLQKITETTGGSYQRATDSGIETVNLLNNIRQVKGKLLEGNLQIRKIERFELFIFLAMITLMLEVFIRYGQHQWVHDDT